MMEGEEELSVICIKVVVERKGRDKSAEESGIHDGKQGIKNRALRNTAGREIQRRHMAVTFDTEGLR